MRTGFLLQINQGVSALRFYENIEERNLQEDVSMINTRVLRLLQADKFTLEELAEKLNQPADAIDRILKQMAKSGVTLKVSSLEEKVKYHVDLLPEAGNIVNVREDDGGVMRFVATADWHFGSSFHLPRTWHEAMKISEDAGLTRVYSAGDLIDGIDIYKGHRENLIADGLERQTDLVARALSKHPHLRFFGIAGNHDYSFTQKVGAKPLAILEAKADNFTNLGDMRADIVVNGIKIRMLHGASGRVYATSYPSQTYLRDYFKGLEREDISQLPHLMILGHYHTLYEGKDHGIWILQCGSFQDGENEYCVRRGLTGPHGLFHVKINYDGNQIEGFETKYIQPKLKEQGKAFAKTTRHYK